MANSPDLREQQWLSVYLTNIVVANSIVTVSDTFGLHPKAPISLNLGALQGDFEIKRILSDTQLEIGAIGTGIRGPFLSPTQFNGGTLTMGEVNRNKFGSELVLRAVYQEEPATALRNMLVNKYGAAIDTSLDSEGNIVLKVDADPLPYTDDVFETYDINQNPTLYSFYLGATLKYTIAVTYDLNQNPVRYKTTVI